MKQKINICLTCVGGEYIYDIIRAFRLADDIDIKIIGVDNNSEATGRYFLDHFESVPLPSEAEDYLDRINKIISDFKIDVFIPLSEAESRLLAANKNLIETTGVKLSVLSYEQVDIITDKLKLMKFLNGNGIDVGPFAEVNNLKEADEVLKKLGYPKRKIVLKKRKGTGSRGILIADSSVNEYRPLLRDRFCGEGNFDSLTSKANKMGVDFSDYLAMPYYGNKTYDVDCLAMNGEVVQVIPRLRQYKNPLSPINEGCKIDNNTEVIKLVDEICGLLNVHGSIDLDITLDKNGIPRVLDAGCGLSGSVGASLVAGLNIPAQLVRIMMGFPLVKYKNQNGALLIPVKRFALKDEII